MALEYQSSTLKGTVSMDMIRFIKDGGMLAEKYPIRTLWSVMVARLCFVLWLAIPHWREE